MNRTDVRPQTEGCPYLEFAFSSLAGYIPPRAILSVLESGDMRFDPAGETALRRAFFAKLGLETSRVAALPLRHTRRVVFVKAGREAGPLIAEATSAGGVDGIVAEGQAWVPALTVADCMPIWLHDSRRSLIGLLHSGWKGTGILAEAVRGMEREFGSRPADIEAIFGPCIGACCYAVPEERARRFAREFGEKAVRAEKSETMGARHFIDLRAANIGLAESLGIGGLTNAELCTACSPFLGSYRRQGSADFTRMVALCGFF